MLHFEPVTLAHKDAINQILNTQSMLPCELCFSNIFLWAEQYNTTVCIKDTMLFIKGRTGKSVLHKLPTGLGNKKAAIEALFKEDDFRTLYAITEEDKTLLEENFPGTFTYTEDRAGADYIYTSDKLRTLAGKKLHAKRNHIHKFHATYGTLTIFEEITPENIDEILRFHMAWCKKNGCEGTLRHEVCAVKKAFAHFHELALQGLCLKVNGKIVAYSYGTRLTADTFVIHAEKADSEIPGAYAVINQQMAETFGKEFLYINREEDMGLEGLRKAKESYQPDILRLRYTAQWNNFDLQKNTNDNR